MISTFEIEKSWKNTEAFFRTGGLLSIVMPAYSLREVLEKNIRRVIETVSARIPMELIVVEDGSGDGSAALLDELAGRYPQILTPVILKHNTGKGNALREGVKRATGDFVLLLDGDLDIAPDTLPVFFDVMRIKNADVVVGSKRHKASRVDYPWHRRVPSLIYHTLTRVLTGVPVTDTQTGMKLFRRELLVYAMERMLVKTFAFDLELLSIAAQQGAVIAEAPVIINFGNKLGCLTPRNVRQIATDTLAVFYRLHVLRYYQTVKPQPPPRQTPRFSVIIACPAASAYLTECLTGLAAQTWREFEVIVLPDEPFDEPAAANALARGFSKDGSGGHPRLTILPTGKVRPAEKRNRGGEAATGDIIAFIDDDAAPLPDWLERAAPYFDDPGLGGLGGPGVTPPNDPRMAALSGRVFANPLVSGQYRYRYIPERMRDSVDDFPSCNLFVRKAVYQRIGGFRTDFWPGEDTILCKDIVDLGYRIAYDPWVIVTHHRRALFLPHLRQVGRYALHRGYFAKRLPATSRRIAYMMPSLFVTGLVIGLPLALCFTWAAWLYYGTIGVYLLLTLLFSVDFSLSTWFLTWLGIIATHIVYGVRFIQGILAKRMPCEVARFDHPAETAESR